MKKTKTPSISTLKRSSTEAGQVFERLLNIMDELRNKCPWDKKQTIETLRHLTIEETYELGDAILDKNMENIKKELGDLLLHIVFYSKIASETKDSPAVKSSVFDEGLTTGFDITDVINGLCEKLIHRHPHIFGDVRAETAEKVKKNWEKLKMLEGASSGKEGKRSILEGVPASLPSIVKAYRIQEKMSSAGFDWEKKEQVWEKVIEELNEFKKEVETYADMNRMEFQSVGSPSPPAGGRVGVGLMEDEFGDLLFCLINYARFIDVNPENALERTNKKVIKRFQYMEDEISKAGKQFDGMTLEEMDEHWDKAKEGE
ncbi:MAG: nucleoside triphosphate pyrophosphohydrolase [Bacteroidota bacterium]